MTRLRTAIIVAMLAITGMAMSTATSGASDKVAAPITFSAQADALKLSSQERAELQHRVDRYLATEGGVRVALNKIDLDGSGELLLVLPGETYARDVTTTLVPQAATPCPYEYLCAYSEPNFTGDMRSEARCDEVITIPWYGNGSYKNNQTPGTRGTFYFTDGRKSATGPAYSQMNPFNWDLTYKIDPC